MSLETLVMIEKGPPPCGRANQVPVLDNQAWGAGMVRSQQEDFRMQGAFAVHRDSLQSPLLASWRDRVRKASVEGQLFVLAGTPLALKAEGRASMVLPEGNQKL